MQLIEVGASCFIEPCLPGLTGSPQALLWAVPALQLNLSFNFSPVILEIFY